VLGQRCDVRAAGDLDDLERAHDPPAVARQDLLGRGGIGLGQASVQGT
jgi:hypothetical protein